MNISCATNCLGGTVDLLKYHFRSSYLNFDYVYCMDLHFLLNLCVDSLEKDSTQSALNNGRKRIALGLEPTTLSLRGG